VRLYTKFFYKAGSWGRARRIAAKVEYTELGINVRFVVTNRKGSGEEVFNWYEQRGQAENFIKELKRDIAADRLSCSSYRANAFRLQLHAVTYNLLVLFRHYVLRGTQLASAAIDSVRLRLFKIGARVQRTARRLWFHLASGWPGQPLFCRSGSACCDPRAEASPSNTLRPSPAATAVALSSASNSISRLLLVLESSASAS
jgi:hypothetical protein